MESTEIQKFYKEKTIFITGGTGLLGKALVEKLLRSCPEINKLIVPIRPKRSATSEQRISEYFSNRLFSIIKNNNPDALNKVLFINCNLGHKNCGIDGEQYDFVRRSTNIIFHCAASVEFSASLKEAVNCNVKITKNIIDMAKEMPNLQALIHVSTMWSHAVMDFTEERVYKLSYKPEILCHLVDNIEESILTKITSTILGNWENTYLMTKNVSECLVEAEKNNIPVAVFRPAIVTATHQEPVPGWLNSMQAVTALGLGIATGTIQVVHSNPEYNMHLVPTDLAVNCMIAVAWYTATQKVNGELTVYNYSPVENIQPRKHYLDSFLYTKYPFKSTAWAPGYTTTNSKWLFEKYVKLYHTIPAYISDLFLKLAKRKLIYEKIQKRNKKVLDEGAYFLLQDFKFEYKNVPTLWNILHQEDKKLFNFDLNSINWDDYMDVYTKGVKELLEEDFRNIDECEAKRYLLRCKY